MFNSNIELLAPAGGEDAGFAALQNGADAIYLGMEKFSARAEATNFTHEQLLNFVGYAHHLGKKVYATVNTLIKEDEISDLVKTLSILDSANIDAIIVQDLGVVHIAKTYFPNLRIHASTQMAIHNKEGAEFLRDLGISRVTLARELTLEEISEIASIDNLETEVFLHGALCYSYSGLCLFSSHRTSRSANRGRCAYPCRDMFTLKTKEESLNAHAFSLKDLSLAEHLEDLINTGVDSLKIEGRKKSPLYVSSVVELYKDLLKNGVNSKNYKDNLNKLKTVFSRPLTDFFVGNDKRLNSIDSQIVGHRGAEIGKVIGIVNRNNKDYLKFKSSQALESHDGLQLDLPGFSRPYGFAIDELHTGKKNKLSFTSEKDSLVEVLLPFNHPEIPKDSIVYHSSSQKIKRENKIIKPKPRQYLERTPISIILEVNKNQISAIAKHANSELPITVNTSLNGEFPIANDLSTAIKAMEQSFEKTGNTNLIMQQFEVINDSKHFVPASILNKLRRKLYDDFTQLYESYLEHRATMIIHNIEESKKTTFEDHTQPSNSNSYIIKTQYPEKLLELSDNTLKRFSEIIIDISIVSISSLENLCEQLHLVSSEITIRFALPAICRKTDFSILHEKIDLLTSQGFMNWEVANLWGLTALKNAAPEISFNITADWSLYILNTQAATLLKNIGITRVTSSPEDEIKNVTSLKNICGDFISIIAYQDTPLFIGEACPTATIKGCKGKNENCEQTLEKWQDSNSYKYYRVTQNCRTFLIAQEKFSISGYLDDLKPITACLNFQYYPYDTQEIEQICNEIFNDEFISNSHTANFLGNLI